MSNNELVMAETGSDTSAPVQNGESGIDNPRELNLGAISSQKIELLSDDNWLAWKLRITNLLTLYDVYEYVTGKQKKPAADKVAEVSMWKKKDTVAHTLIYNNIGLAQVVHITECNMSAEVWQALHEVYESHSYQAIITQLRNLLATHAITGADIPKHISEMKMK